MRRTEAVENAWRIHDAQLDWTAKADAKATFVFGVDSAAVGAIAVLISTGHVFVHFEHWYLVVLFVAGCAAILGSVAYAAAGVKPRLKGRVAKKMAKNNFIYFGHARHWKPRALERRLRHDDLLGQLANQIQVTADIAWKKHVNVVCSVWLTIAAGAFWIAYIVVSRFA